MIQAQPIPEAMMQRVAHLQQKMNDQMGVSNQLKAHSQDLETRINDLRIKNEESIQKVREYTEKVESLQNESQCLPMLKAVMIDLPVDLIKSIINLVSWLLHFVTCNRFNN